MSGGSRGIFSKAPIAPTLLIECDSTGKVLWMSQQARDLLGDAAHLPDVVGVAVPVSCGRRARVYPSHFRRVWESRNSVLISVRLPECQEAAVDFQPLESRLFQKFFQLVVQERRLYDSVRKLARPGSGRAAIRQIELERQRLARELHTGVGQILVAIRLQVEVITTELPHPPPRVGQMLDSINALAGSALEYVRSVAQRLHPPEWQRLTLASAMRQLWEVSGIPDRFEGELRIHPLPMEPVPEVRALLYRTMQEALSNLTRHSRATRVDAELRADGPRAVLTVTDNGVGFDVARLWAAPPSVSSGIGLRSIREQVEELAGDFDMQSGPLGTRLLVSVVMDPSED